MSIMKLDLVTSLTQEGPSFEGAWANFPFNEERAIYLKEK